MNLPSDALLDQLAGSIRSSTQQYINEQLSALNSRILFITLVLSMLVMTACIADLCSTLSVFWHAPSEPVAHSIGPAALIPVSSLLFVVLALCSVLFISLLAVFILAGELRPYWFEQFHICKLHMDPRIALFILTPFILGFVYMLPSQVNSYIRVDDRGIIISQSGSGGEARYQWDDIEQVKKVRLNGSTVYRLYFSDSTSLTIHRPIFIQGKVDSAMLYIATRTQRPVRNIGSYG